MDEDRAGQPGPRLELGEQPVDVVDVLGALHLGHHDHVELVADLGDERREVVEDPGAVQRVDPRPQLGVGPEVGGPGDGDEPGPGGVLAVGLDRVLEVAEEHVDRPDEAGHLGRHLLVARVEEVDDPGGAGRDLPDRGRGPDGEGREEVLGAAHGRQRSNGRGGAVMTAVTPARRRDRSLG